MVGGEEWRWVAGEGKEDFVKHDSVGLEKSIAGVGRWDLYPTVVFSSFEIYPKGLASITRSRRGVRTGTLNQNMVRRLGRRHERSWRKVGFVVDGVVWVH